MREAKDRRLRRAQRLLLAAMAVLVAGVLAVSGMSRVAVTRSREEGQFTQIEPEIVAQDECRFTLGNIGQDGALVFYISHHAIEVTIGGECVYTLAPSPGGTFATVGGAWVQLPLRESDAGQEIRVRLTPLYANYETEWPEFLVGSEIAIYRAALGRALPMLMLSLCVVFTGFLLICLALYHRTRGMPAGRMCALGLLAISAGAWRVTYDRVAYLLCAEHTVLIYTASIVSLMAVALSMLNSLEAGEKGTRAIRLCSCGYCAVYLVLLALQLAGAADLRQTLKVVHVTIVISAAAFVVSGLRQWRVPRTARNGRGNYGWILGAGVAIDLGLYYLSATSVSMIFTLVAILCYSVLEGLRMLFTYIEQKNALEEMKTQLTLSRTTTMMSQIRSHFVFNVLNAISGMCKYDPERADETVVRFARYLRSNIDIMESDKNLPFSTDLAQLEDYVALEQVRFGDKIEFYTDIEVDNFLIPPLILQPVVENAIKHGLSKKRDNGTIVLRTREADGRVVITVEDDGVGFAMEELEKETSVGIRNIRFRLEHLVHGTLDIQSTVGEGTTVTITIPREDKSCT